MIFLLFPQAHIRHKLTKEQRMELVKAGREDRVKYQSRTATKQKKVSVLCLLVYSKGLLLQHLMFA